MDGCKSATRFVSYAQNAEDVYLERCFKSINTGFYIDVGANGPVSDSVTAAFYKRGWSGINIEPNPYRFSELRYARPRDINLLQVCSEKTGDIKFGVRTDHDGLSSILISDPDRMRIINSYSEPLAETCQKHVTGDIHFLKIDVEGAELSVLRSADFTAFRPQVIILEATKPNSTIQCHEEWEPLLLEQEYLFARFDGLNRYYVAKEHDALLQHFDSPVSCLDDVDYFNRSAFVLDDHSHPDYAWARQYCARFLLAAGHLHVSVDFQVLTYDTDRILLDAEPNDLGIQEAFGRCLHRGAIPDEVAYCLTLPTLSSVYQHLVDSDEFRLRRIRAYPNLA